jgi:hypothetical protein
LILTIPLPFLTLFLFFQNQYGIWVVNLNVIALGLLQILALELPQGIWANFPRWFRTLPSHGYPSERIAQLALQHQAQMIFPQSPPSLLLPKFLAAKLASSPSPDMLTLAA